MVERIHVRDELEKDIEQKACNEIALKLGVRHLKFNSGSDTSWPDRIFLVPGGRPVLIEFKRPGGVPDAKQAYTHEILRKLGYDIEVHDSVAGAFRCIERALAAT